jgi:transcriptional regulator with GAF, ATPase, and Fis domain
MAGTRRIDEVPLVISSPLLAGRSDAFRYLQFRIDEVAPTAATVLLLGETGTGKSLIAREIHRRSQQRIGRFVSVNCAALPSTLLESELFGHERGAFTDARTTQVGRLELAQHGTLFLDEVGELALDSQSKLLRFLHDGEFERLGSLQTVRVTTRVVAATNRPLEDEVHQGRFRRDLFFRINVFPISVPPLRDRRADIPLLVHQLVRRIGVRYGRTIEVPAEVMKTLERHDWPGNVRELENVLERTAILCRDGVLRLDSLELGVVRESASDRLEDVERSHILKVMGHVAWRIEGEGGAAHRLGLKASTLRSLMQRLDIRRPAPPPRPRAVVPSQPSTA